MSITMSEELTIAVNYFDYGRLLANEPFGEFYWLFAELQTPLFLSDS